ncbi:unnamed protein product [Effrenium voratum]|uniref:SH3 domain-containing protein n=1 Tax=Effrenium voratum TaxID=2562239 RepID=A0AA36NCE7_9DINO|nr:unnamed protein product [Effrenium voratum]
MVEDVVAAAADHLSASMGEKIKVLETDQQWAWAESESKSGWILKAALVKKLPPWKLDKVKARAPAPVSHAREQSGERMPALAWLAEAVELEPEPAAAPAPAPAAALAPAPAAQLRGAFRDLRAQLYDGAGGRCQFAGRAMLEG